MIRLLSFVLSALFCATLSYAQEYTTINRDTLITIDPATGEEKMVIVEDVVKKNGDTVVQQEMVVDIPSPTAQAQMPDPDSLTTQSVDTLISIDPVTGEEVMIITETVGVNRPDTFTIVGVGDVMLGTNFPGNGKYLPPNNGHTLLTEAERYLQTAHVTFGNMEGAISDDAPLEKRCKDTTKCYAFRMPIKYADHLQTAGFDMMSLANNHAWDFGIEGVRDATTKLDELGIAYAGPQQFPWDTLTRYGVKIGFAAFAPNKGCMHLLDRKKAVATVAHLDSISDIVIVSFHGGAEGKDHQHITGEDEFYYGENRGNVQAFSKAMIDAGADVVFGHGPHVVRAVEVYKDRFIAYSLGNFATYARFNLTGVNGYAPAVKVYTDLEGQFLEAEVISFLQRGEGGPKLDPDQQAFKKMASLTQSDIKGHGLSFEDGWIRKIK